MVRVDNLVKQSTKPVDQYLKFVQEHFNTSGGNFKDIVKQLDAYSKAQQPYSATAGSLKDRLKVITILSDFNKYKKFDKLGDLGFSEHGIKQVYKVSNEIIRDIDVARDWIDSYKAFSKLMQTINVKGLHQELILLGKSILGRAIELCPMDTGTLRNSGILIDYGTYIIIAFTAPYASYVHENMEISHPNHSRNSNCGGRAKFLEVALQEFFPKRAVWTENHGYEGVMCKISVNPEFLEYSHYD